MSPNDKSSVVLVHGIYDTAKKMKHMETYLRHFGWNAYSVNLRPSSGKIGIDELGKQLEIFINDHIPSDQKLDLVGFSMGGLVCRYYIQRLGGLARTEHFITISTPHHGTRMAYFSNSTGAKQMRRNSELLCDLNKDIEKLSLLKFTSIWTPLDLMILPASSSHLTIGDEIKILCTLHPFMVSHYKCLQSIKTSLLK